MAPPGPGPKTTSGARGRGQENLPGPWPRRGRGQKNMPGPWPRRGRGLKVFPGPWPRRGRGVKKMPGPGPGPLQTLQNLLRALQQNYFSKPYENRTLYRYKSESEKIITYYDKTTLRNTIVSLLELDSKTVLMFGI